MIVCRMSLHQVPWMESDPVKKSAHTGSRWQIKRDGFQSNTMIRSEAKSETMAKMKRAAKTNKPKTTLQMRLQKLSEYRWRVWLWPEWESGRDSALRIRLTKLSLGHWGSGWTAAAPPSSPKLWSGAELCSQHFRTKTERGMMTLFHYIIILMNIFLCLICFSVELDNMRTCCVGLFCLPQLVYLSQ